MKKLKNNIYKRILSIAIGCLLIVSTSACSFSENNLYGNIDNEEETVQGMTVIGFSQPGAESAWRVALTESVKSAFTEDRGYKLIYKDGQSKQDNQIKDIRTFIQQGVDYIILSPIVETGWDQVLEEAKDASIPVIICDRGVTVSNESLYTAYAGSNFKSEGQAAVDYLEKIWEQKCTEKESIEVVQSEEQSEEQIEETEVTEEEPLESVDDEESSMEDVEISISEGDMLNIVHIQGTLGSSAQVGRTKALEEAVLNHSDWRIIAQECGDFTKGKAREVMNNILSEVDGNSINVVYCENDEEAFGVMAALNEAGLSYGVDGDIIIISFDGTSTALSMCMSGLINMEVECNPLQGQYLYNIISRLQKGEKVPKLAYIDETSFTQDLLSQEFIDSRQY